MPLIFKTRLFLLASSRKSIYRYINIFSNKMQSQKF